MSDDFLKDAESNPPKRTPEQEAQIEAILTASLNTQPGLSRLASAMIGRYKRLIFGYKCNNCGSDEVYRQGAVIWGPYGGHYECGQCKFTGDMYQSIVRKLVTVYQINEDGTETPKEQTNFHKQGHTGFTCNPSDKNCGATLRRWTQISRSPEVWEECEVPKEERPTNRVWNKLHKHLKNNI
jgi:ribosomal protein L37AE/L43A